MTHGQRLLVVLLSLTGTLGACSSGGTASPDAGDTPTIDANGGDPVLLSMAVTPASLELTVGDAATLAVEGTYDDDTTGPVTGGIWGSSAAAIATVTSAGVVTAQGAGSATLTFTAQGQSVDVPVTVTGNGSLRIVFGDDFGADISFAPFGGSAGGAVVDTAVAHTGSSSLRVDVPTSGYTGGAFKIASPVDLSGFGAVTFWAKASTANALNVAGLGNDSLDTTYLAE